MRKVRYRLIVLLIFTLATFASVQAAPQPAVYLPLVANAAQPAPPPAIEELPTITSPVYLYGAVQPSPVPDRTGAWWLLAYWIRTTPEPGSYVARWRPGQELELIGGRLSNGPRGSLAVGCDGLLYAFIFDADDTYILHLYRVNAFPGPAYTLLCNGQSPRIVATTRGLQVLP